MNNVSARDIQMSTSQWSLGNSLDTFAPLGPAIVTKDEIPDPHSPQHQIDYRASCCSSITPLQPRDIISTGTPSGVGLGRTHHRWLRPGETIITEIQGIGQLVNPAIAEA
jgi:2-keto-4-pentenoate hydratase/2-oxohepta-3-ene-1,7-dioic acid hydratase in catechol pathway